MKQRGFLVVMSVVVAMMVSTAVPIAIGAPQEQDIVVTSTADSGPGTLREALERATPGITITFDAAVFPPDTPATIAVISPLPALAQGQVTIDGSNAGVILNGSALSSGQGLYITSNGNVIKGLQILHFPGFGLSIVGGAQNNTIGGDRTVGAGLIGQGNVISGNGLNGIGISGVGEPRASNNVVTGNYIGTDPTGSLAWGNGHHGIWIHRSANNTIGGTAPGERNVISGNEFAGVRIEYPESRGNIVIGNYIGTDATGTIAVGGNNHGGVTVDWGGSENRIGGSAEGEGNIISGNTSDGVHIRGEGTDHNLVLGNFIGTDATGTAAISNAAMGVAIVEGAQHNLVGGTTPGERNLISGNWDGVNISGSGTTNNIVIGNYIGTDATGTAAIGNTVDGVWIGDGAQHNLIGGGTAGERNVISGNGNTGVVIDGSMYNTVSGNHIGTDATGTRALGNATGVGLSWGAQYNLIGGDTAEERNIISGNEWEGVWIGDPGTSNNTVSGNYIGTDASGTAAIPNGNFGVNLGNSAQNNLIGGDTADEGNLISGNGAGGVNVAGNGVMYNIVSGNYIGTDATGMAAIGNTGHGIAIGDGARNNVIGGPTAGECNVISGNGEDGVFIHDSGTMYNTVSGNYIGTDASGTKPLGNLNEGVLIDEGAGRNSIGPGNIIAHNGQDGVRVDGSDTVGNTITANSIYDNEGWGIQNLEGGNAELSPPMVTYVGTRLIRGTARPNATVEIFSDEEDEGRLFEGSTVAGEEGDFAFRIPVGRFTGPNVTATATDTEGNTSGFSPPESPPAPVVTRELPDIVAPTQVSVEPKVVGTNLGLALFCVLFFGLTSTVFNSILVDYHDELVDISGRLIPRPLTVALDRVGLSLHGMTEKGRSRLLLMWLILLLVTSLIESFLDPEVGVLSPERLGILITLFISAVVVSALELGSDLYAHRRLAPTMKAESKIQWIGMAMAVACVILSRALDFKPGYLYGIVGAIYLMPRLPDVTNSGKRAGFVLLTIFTGGFILWIATAFLPATLAELEPLFLTIFLISLQGVFFALFPLAITDGGDIWSWRRGVWFVFFSIVFFCFYHFLLNPNASDVQALQQNGVQTLLILIVVFGLTTFTLWLLFPFRLGRKRVSES